MFKALKRRRLGEGHERGFTLIELLIVILIVGILAAVAVPLYLGYTQDAKLAEGKALVGSVWTSLQAVAQQNCGAAQSINNSFARAGLNAAGETVPSRWTVSPANGSVQIACGTGLYSLSTTMLVTGVSGDNSALRINLGYDGTVTTGPPTIIRCSTDGGVTFFNC